MIAARLAPALHAGSSPHGDNLLFWLTIGAVMLVGVYSWLRHRR
jgi:hypothetical protein